MQDVNNIPPPSDDTSEANDDFGSHSDVEQDLDNKDIEQVEDAEDIPQEINPQAGVSDQYPDTGSGRNEGEQDPNLEPQ